MIGKMFWYVPSLMLIKFLLIFFYHIPVFMRKVSLRMKGGEGNGRGGEGGGGLRKLCNFVQVLTNVFPLLHGKRWKWREKVSKRLWLGGETREVKVKLGGICAAAFPLASSSSLNPGACGQLKPCTARHDHFDFSVYHCLPSSSLLTNLNGKEE